MMNKLQFYVLVIFSVVLSLVLPFVLPERFFLDAILIVKDPWDEKGWIGSYPISMMFYHLTKLGKLPFSIVALIQLPILYFILRLVGIPERFQIFTIKNILIYLCFVMMAIFIGQPSKEFFTFIFIGIIVLLFQQKVLSLGICLLISFLMFFIFGAIFRPYFTFIPIISIGIFLITRIRFKNRWILGIVAGIAVIVLLSFSYSLVKGEFFSGMTRETINLERMNKENADTMLVSPIAPTNIFGEAFATVYGFISVNFPINALKFFYKPQVVAFVVWQLLLTWIIVVRFGYLLKDYTERKKEFWLMLFFLSYLVIQAIFEPDLGSAVRHKIGILPLIYFLFYYDEFKRKLQ